MLSILNLALPFFGVIFIGFACGKWRRIPDAGLAWMNVFILYVALPALFFRILSRTPLEQLAQIDFVTATVLASASAFTGAYIVGLILRRGNLGEATIAAVAGGFGNVGYMGPGLSLAAIGPEASVPVALIFSFDALLIFTLVPLLMAFSGSSTGLGRALRDVARSIFLNPLLIAAALGGGAAASSGSRRGRRPAAAVPLHVGRALRAVRARRHGGAAPARAHAVGGAAACGRQAGGAPDPGAGAARLARAVQRVWVNTAVLMAALPPALSAYVFARQYDVWIEQASSVVLIGTLASVATLTAVMWLVQTHALVQLLPR